MFYTDYSAEFNQWQMSLSLSLSLSQVFKTSLAEPIPEGYEHVTDIVPPYSAFSAKGQPEVMHTTHTAQYKTQN